MKFDQIFLHIGPHKTGSTAIQSACDCNRDRLSRFGILYPNGRWQAELGSYFCDDLLGYIYNRELVESQGRCDIEQIKREDNIFFRDLTTQIEQTTCRKLILSYEGFAELTTPALCRMRDYLASFSSQITVVAYCRAPLAFACSAISQTIKSGRPSDVAKWPQILKYKDYAEKFAEVFGSENIVFRKFSAKDMPEGNVILDFLNCTGLPVETIKSFDLESIDDNQSLSAEATLLGNAILSAHPMEAVGNTFRDDFTPILNKLSGQRNTLDKKQAEATLAAAKPHLDFLAQHYGIKFEDESKLINDKPQLFSNQAIAALSEQIYRLVSARTLARKQLSDLTQGMKALRLQYTDDNGRLKDVVTPSLKIESARLREGGDIIYGQLMSFDVDFFLAREVPELVMSIFLLDSDQQCAFSISSTMMGQSLQKMPNGLYRASHHMVAELPAGKYTAGFTFSELLHKGEVVLAQRVAMCEFQVNYRVTQPFSGYSYLPAQMSLTLSKQAMPERVVKKTAGSIVVTQPVSTIQIDQTVKLCAEVFNRSKQDWLGDSCCPIRLSYHWLKLSGETLIFEGLRTSLSAGGVSAGKSLVADILVRAPNEAGRHILVLTLLQERVGWFENMGFEPLRLEVEVKPSST